MSGGHGGVVQFDVVSDVFFVHDVGSGRLATVTPVGEVLEGFVERVVMSAPRDVDSKRSLVVPREDGDRHRTVHDRLLVFEHDDNATAAELGDAHPAFLEVLVVWQLEVDAIADEPRPGGQDFFDLRGRSLVLSGRPGFPRVVGVLRRRDCRSDGLVVESGTADGAGGKRQNYGNARSPQHTQFFNVHVQYYTPKMLICQYHDHCNDCTGNIVQP